METKTLKQQALEFLEMDNLTKSQESQLERLTALQAGYEEITMQEGYHDAYPLEVALNHRQREFIRLMDFDELWGYLYLPSFVNSVDACLELPLPDGQWWLMTSHTAASPICSAAIVLERNRQFAKTIPFAMLKAWWTIQPD